MTISHKRISRFHLEGEIYDDAAIPRLKDQYINMIRTMMEGKGYVQRYDIDPDFTILYNGRTFEFKLSLYGVYVGKRQAQCIAGVDKNRPVLKPTQTPKSNERSLPAV